MNLCGPVSFQLTYTSTNYQILGEEQQSRFSGHPSSRKPKLYVFSRDNTPLYVGATIRPMGDRMRSGWKADGVGGFYGYRFRHDEQQQARLDIWTDIDPVRQRDDGMRSGSDIETIEAEIVYLIRRRTEQWPAYQTEIHFYPSNYDHRREAMKVIDHFHL
jgi:hypothetical protein